MRCAKSKVVCNNCPENSKCSMYLFYMTNYPRTEVISFDFTTISGVLKEWKPNLKAKVTNPT